MKKLFSGVAVGAIQAAFLISAAAFLAELDFAVAQSPPNNGAAPGVPNAAPGGGSPSNGGNFAGSDGSTQFSVGNTASATEYVQAVGGITGSGGSLISRNAAQTGNVNLHVTAQGSGAVDVNNGNGNLFSFADPGGVVTDHITTTPSKTSAPPTMGGTTGVNLTGTLVEANGAPIRTSSNDYPQSSLNVNGDFQIDQINEGSSITPGTSGVQVIDGWRVTQTQNSKLSYQRTIGGFSAYRYSEKVNVASQETIGATDHTEWYSNIMGPDAAILQWGTANGLPIIVDGCLSGGSSLSYPAVIPIFLSNGDAGGTYRYYIHEVTLSAAATPTCFSIPIPADTNSVTWGQTFGNVGLQIGIEFAAGANFQSTIGSWTGSLSNGVLTVASGLTGSVVINDVIGDATQTISPGTKITSQLTGTPNGVGTYQTNGSQTVGSESMSGSQVDAWGTGRFYSFVGATNLAALAASSNASLSIGGVHVRIGSVDSVYQPLPYAVELARAQKRYWKTFNHGTKPATNAGANTGEIQFDAETATTGVQRAPRILFPQQLDGASPTVTFYNPSAAAATCQDETASGATGTPAAVNVTMNGMGFTATGNASTAVGNLIGCHITVDAGV